MIGPNKATLILAAFAIVCATGCTGLGEKGFGRFTHLTAKSREPAKMLLMMTTARMETNGEPVKQGVNCRIYFFAHKDPIPTSVDGDLLLTAYDLSNPNGNRPPDGKYEIDASQLKSHHRTDIVGDHYQFWLPYEPRGKTQLQFQARFAAKEGKEIVSDLVTVDIEPLAAPVMHGARSPVRMPPSRSQNAMVRQQLPVDTPENNRETVRPVAGRGRVARLQQPVAN